MKFSLCYGKGVARVLCDLNLFYDRVVSYKGILQSIKLYDVVVCKCMCVSVCNINLFYDKGLQGYCAI